MELVAGHFEILNPGQLTTFQDLGREGFERFGVSRSGPADCKSFLRGLSILSVELRRGFALEMTFVGPKVKVVGTRVQAVLTGGEVRAKVDGHPVPMDEVFEIQDGETLDVGPILEGCRSYLFFSKSVQVEAALGSISTHLQSGLGPNLLKKGDHVRFGQTLIKTALPKPALKARENFSGTLRVIAREGFQTLSGKEYTVSANLSRLGIRLEGERIYGVGKSETIGVDLGTVQINPDGLPTILFVEQQLTGGYPSVGTVIRADHGYLGQLKGGDTVRFVSVTLKEAERAWKEIYG